MAVLCVLVPLIHVHETAAKNGQYFMDSGVNFSRVKISNNKEADQSLNMVSISFVVNVKENLYLSQADVHGKFCEAGVFRMWGRWRPFGNSGVS